MLKPWSSRQEVNVEKVSGAGDSFVIRNNNKSSPINADRSCLRGVNLGGWLVLEKWMAPHLFSEVPSASDERSLLALGGEAARDAVCKFRESFIVEQDLHWLKQEGGIDAVRLPVGYWCIDEHAKGSGYLSTQRFVDAAFDWAERQGLKVLLDLHGMSGSQNGEHHSGESGRLSWLEPGHREKNLQVVQAVAARWGRRSSLLGLGLGNEVAEKEPTLLQKMASSITCDGDSHSRRYWVEVAKFYSEAASLAQPYLRRDVILVLDTCWDMDRWTVKTLERVPGHIWLDYHHYQCMGGDAGVVDEHLEARDFEKLLVEDFRPFPLIIGEFSLALQPGAQGYDTDPDWPQKFFQRQSSLAEKHAAAWFFWNYKMARDGWPHWSYRESVERGWIMPRRVKSEV
mmetsp:Transcript_27394/g.63821  ORF Transcript_27394/g.63821 Transcript_27394/m.63821 type:complete len:399 (+) Transcript_27394:63-1259(+)